uniref:Protein-tyrosine-phosphatase n=1 Tax=Panagrolaimus davidi TaxID=227884 RepID=A0A914QEJ3_9BILA
MFVSHLGDSCISSILDHLYLSGAGAISPGILKDKSITCIINVTHTEEFPTFLAEADFLRIGIDDTPRTKISDHFDTAADKIKLVKDTGGKVLVHCVQGVSRSASLCIVYLMKYEGMSLRKAYQHVKKVRPIIAPNIGFWKQMIEYETQIYGKSTVTIERTKHKFHYCIKFDDKTSFKQLGFIDL